MEHFDILTIGMIAILLFVVLCLIFCGAAFIADEWLTPWIERRRRKAWRKQLKAEYEETTKRG